MVLSRAPCSTRSTMAPSSSSARRDSEFWLSPSRSKIAQAMPCGSIENRQSFSPIMSTMALPRWPHLHRAVIPAQAGTHASS